VGETGTDFVEAEGVGGEVGIDGMVGDGRDIDLAELVDVAEDLLELFLEGGGFGFGELKPGQSGHVGDVNGSVMHRVVITGGGRSLKSFF
jgi:hypothetical protein